MFAGISGGGRGDGVVVMWAVVTVGGISGCDLALATVDDVCQ
jgi:hypothetical protein